MLIILYLQFTAVLYIKLTKKDVVYTIYLHFWRQTMETLTDFKISEKFGNVILKFYVGLTYQFWNIVIHFSRNDITLKTISGEYMFLFHVSNSNIRSALKVHLQSTNICYN